MGALPLSVLFSTDRPEAPLVAVFSGASSSGRPTRIPGDLLLLSKGVLSRVFFGPAGLRSKRKGQPTVPRRDFLSVHSSKSPSLVSLHRLCISRLPVAGCNSRFLFQRRVRNRRGITCPAGKYRPADSLHFFMPLPSSPGGRKARLLLLHVVWPYASRCVAVAWRLEWTPHALCMDESHFSGSS